MANVLSRATSALLRLLKSFIPTKRYELKVVRYKKGFCFPLENGMYVSLATKSQPPAKFWYAPLGRELYFPVVGILHAHSNGMAVMLPYLDQLQACQMLEPFTQATAAHPGIPDIIDPKELLVRVVLSNGYLATAVEGIRILDHFQQHCVQRYGKRKDRLTLWTIDYELMADFHERYVPYDFK